MSDSLEEKCLQFHMLQLPGQPQFMHMGTSHLVSELWIEIKRLRSEAEVLKKENKELSDQIDNILDEI